jgi:hypothetical protein
LNRLQEETNSSPREPLPRVNARDEEPSLDTSSCQQEEDFTEARENALHAEEKDVQLTEGKNRALADTKLFLVPAFSRRLWAHSDNFHKADLLQAFIEHTANCPSLRDFRGGYTIHINHAIGTNIINFAAIGYIASCLNLEDEVLNGDVPVDSQRYLAK